MGGKVVSVAVVVDTAGGVDEVEGVVVVGSKYPSLGSFQYASICSCDRGNLMDNGSADIMPIPFIGGNVPRSPFSATA